MFEKVLSLRLELANLGMDSDALVTLQHGISGLDAAEGDLSEPLHEAPLELATSSLGCELEAPGFVVVASEIDNAVAAEAIPQVLVSIVAPFYNPGPKFELAIREIIAALEETGVSYEVIAVNDGSTDSSHDVLSQLGISTIKDVDHIRRHGKGAALRTGLMLGKGSYLGFIDADGDIDPAALGSFLSTLRESEPDIVLGSKRHPMSEVSYPPLRRAYSALYQLLIRVLFNLSIKDTQTGIKLCRRDVIEQVLPLMVEKRFAFDLELFVVARRLGYKNFVEAPVVIRERFSSTINFAAVLRTVIDTLAIYYRERVLHFYDRNI